MKTAEGGIPGSRGMLSPLRRGVRGEAEPLLRSSVTSEAMSHGCLTSTSLGLTDEEIIDIYLPKKKLKTDMQPSDRAAPPFIVLEERKYDQRRFKKHRHHRPR